MLQALVPLMPPAHVGVRSSFILPQVQMIFLYLPRKRTQVLFSEGDLSQGLESGKGKEADLFSPLVWIYSGGRASLSPWSVTPECPVSGLGKCGESQFSPSEEERDVKCGAVQIDKLKKKHFQGEAVLPLRLCARLLCGQKGSRV